MVETTVGYWADMTVDQTDYLDVMTVEYLVDSSVMKMVV